MGHPPDRPVPTQETVPTNPADDRHPTLLAGTDHQYPSLPHDTAAGAVLGDAGILCGGGYVAGGEAYGLGAATVFCRRIALLARSDGQCTSLLILCYVRRAAAGEGEIAKRPSFFDVNIVISECSESMII